MWARPFHERDHTGLSSNAESTPTRIPRTHEPFGPTPGLTPGIAVTPARAPHAPAGKHGDRNHDRVRTRRRAVPSDNGDGSLLELAEACDVPVRWSCRTGVCRTYETALVVGDVD